MINLNKYFSPEETENKLETVFTEKSKTTEDETFEKGYV
jgi:hypothetical protein